MFNVLVAFVALVVLVAFVALIVLIVKSVCMFLWQERERQIKEFLHQPARPLSRYSSVKSLE